MTTPIFDELTVVLLDRREFVPPQCEHFEHEDGTHPERHSGPARFELIMPCGKPFKVCAQFVAWLDAGGKVTCSARPEKHDKSNIVWVPL